MRYFWKSEKGFAEIENWDFPVHFVLGFQENSNYTLAKILLNGTKVIQKLTSSFKNHMKNLDNSIKVVESPKILNLMCYFCQKNPFFQLKHYFQGIYLTLLSTNSMKIHQSPYLIFETISYFSRHNSSVFFLAQILHTFFKVAHQNTNFQAFYCSR